jgi:hypothetical protein
MPATVAGHISGGWVRLNRETASTRVGPTPRQRDRRPHTKTAPLTSQGVCEEPLRNGDMGGSSAGSREHDERVSVSGL